jgi:hypothetical protein
MTTTRTRTRKTTTTTTTTTTNKQTNKITSSYLLVSIPSRVGPFFTATSSVGLLKPGKRKNSINHIKVLLKCKSSSRKITYK